MNRFSWLGLTTMLGLSLASANPSASEDHSGPARTLLETVLRATEQFRDPKEAEAQEYVSANACVSGPEEGAMGVHFIKGSILMDGQLDPEHPEALIYEVRNGRARLVGVEFIVIAEQWHAQNAGTPALMGQLLNYVGSPNRYGLPPFYELHVWAWRSNPKGVFVDWNPAVSCAGFEPEVTSSSSMDAHTHGLIARSTPRP